MSSIENTLSTTSNSSSSLSETQSRFEHEKASKIALTTDLLARIMCDDYWAHKIKELATRDGTGCRLSVLVTSSSKGPLRQFTIRVGHSQDDERAVSCIFLLVSLDLELAFWSTADPSGGRSSESVGKAEFDSLIRLLLEQKGLPDCATLSLSQLQDLADGRPLSLLPREVDPPVALLRQGSPAASAPVLPQQTGPTQEMRAHSDALHPIGPNHPNAPADRFTDHVMEADDYALRDGENRESREFYRKTTLTEEEAEEDEAEEKANGEIMVDPVEEEELGVEITPPSEHSPPLSSSASSALPSSSRERSGAGREDVPLGVPRTPTHSTPPSAHPTPSTPSTLSTNSNVSPVRPPTRKRFMSLADLETQPARKLAKWVDFFREENKLRREHETLATTNAYEMRVENRALEAHLDNAIAELSALSPPFGPLQQHEAAALSIKSRLEAVVGQNKMELKMDKKTGNSTVQSFWRSISATLNCRLRMVKSVANAALPRLTLNTVRKEANRAAIQAFVACTQPLLNGLADLKEQAESFHALVIRERTHGRKVVRSSASLRGMYEAFKKAGNDHLEEFHQWDRVVNNLPY